jgi:hypothetical protein
MNIISYGIIPFFVILRLIMGMKGMGNVVTIAFVDNKLRRWEIQEN